MVPPPAGFFIFTSLSRRAPYLPSYTICDTQTFPCPHLYLRNSPSGRHRALALGGSNSPRTLMGKASNFRSNSGHTQPRKEQAMAASTCRRALGHY
jgi:hypothetical protein